MTAGAPVAALGEAVWGWGRSPLEDGHRDRRGSSWLYWFRAGGLVGGNWKWSYRLFGGLCLREETPSHFLRRVCEHPRLRDGVQSRGNDPGEPLR